MKGTMKPIEVIRFEVIPIAFTRQNSCSFMIKHTFTLRHNVYTCEYMWWRQSDVERLGNVQLSVWRSVVEGLVGLVSGYCDWVKIVCFEAPHFSEWQLESNCLGLGVSEVAMAVERGP